MKLKKYKSCDKHFSMGVVGWEIYCFWNGKGIVIQKLGNISIRYLVYSQELHLLINCGRVLEFLAQKQLVNSTKFGTFEYMLWNIMSCYWSNTQSGLGTQLGKIHETFQEKTRHLSRHSAFQDCSRKFLGLSSVFYVN